MTQMMICPWPEDSRRLQSFSQSIDAQSSQHSQVSQCWCCRVGEIFTLRICPQVFSLRGLSNFCSVPAIFFSMFSRRARASGMGYASSRLVVSTSTRCVCFVRPRRPKFLTCMTCRASQLVSHLQASATGKSGLISTCRQEWID